MEFKILKASDFCFEAHETFETIEQLRDFVIRENGKFKACVIYWDTMELIIYDYWIE